jgi:hypothetical protein
MWVAEVDRTRLRPFLISSVARPEADGIARRNRGAIDVASRLEVERTGARRASPCVDNRVKSFESRGFLVAFEQRRKALRAMRDTCFNRVGVRAVLAASVKPGVDSRRRPVSGGRLWSRSIVPVVATRSVRGDDGTAKAPPAERREGSAFSGCDQRLVETRDRDFRKALLGASLVSRRQAGKANDFATRVGSSQRELRGSVTRSPHSNDDAAAASASATAGSVKPGAYELGAIPPTIDK